MKIQCFLSMISLLLLCSAETNAQIMASYYVSPSGSDDHPGTEAQPFRTIQKARDVIRTRPGAWTGDIYVWLRGGTYTLANTLEFTEEDSGKDGHYVAYQAYTGERPVISGGIPVTGWEEYQGGIYRAPCGSQVFRQLYVNGKKAVRARTPNTGTYNRMVSWDASGQTIRVKAGELGNVQNLAKGKVEMIVQQYWAESIMRIESATANGSFEDLTINNTEGDIVFNREWPLKSPDQAYHFENSLDFLDQEGEWYLDDRTSPHYIYYKPCSGEDMSAAAVVAPAVETLVSVTGTGFGSHAHHLVFEGITFEHANWTRPTYQGNIGLQEQQYSVNSYSCDRPAAAFYIENADHMRLTRNVFRNCGSAGLDIYTSTNGIVVEGNVFHDISGNGMQIGKFSEANEALNTVYHPSDTREYCESNVVANNYLYTCATDYYCAVGIAAGFVRNTSIIHNEITDMPYTGINCGWGWTLEPNVMRNNHIEYNLVYDVMKLLCDGGGIYTLGNQGPASTIQYNYIHNTVRSIWATTQYTPTYPVASIYLDAGSSGFSIDQNVVVNTEPEWEVNFNGTEDHNTLGTNPPDDPGIIAGAGIQPAFQDIKLIDPMPDPPAPPAPPIPVEGLKLWLKADAQEGVVVKDINDRVSTWGDRSGYTNTAIQATGLYQPLYVAGAINGKPTLRFDGEDDRMDIAGLAGSMQNFTFMMVIMPDGLADYNQSTGALGGWGQFLFHASAGGTVYCGTSVPARLTTAGGVMADSAVQGFTFVYPGTGTESALYQNGIQVASGLLSEAPAAWTGFLLGAAGSNTLKGDVPEMIIYDRALSDQERRDVESYLETKYGYGAGLTAEKPPGDIGPEPGDVPDGPARALSVYPNPVSSTLQVKWETCDSVQVKTVYVYSMHRGPVYQGDIPPGRQQTRISFASLPEGIYVLRALYTDGTHASVKVIKQ